MDAQTIIADACLRYNLPYEPGKTGGLERILISLALIDEDIMAQLPAANIKPEGFKHFPVRKRDPLGALLTQQPIIEEFESEFISIWKEEGIEKALSKKEFWNPVHVNWALHMLQTSTDLVKEYQKLGTVIDGKTVIQKDGKEDAGLIHRFDQQRRFFDATESKLEPSSGQKECIKRAREVIKEIIVPKKFWSKAAFLPEQIIRKDQKGSQVKEDYDSPKKHTKETRGSLPEAIAGARQSKPTKNEIQTTRKQAASNRFTSILRKQAALYVVAAPPAGQLDVCEFGEIAQAAVQQQDNPVAYLAGMTITGWMLPEQLTTLKMIQTSNGGWIGQSKVALPHDLPGDNGVLHYPSSDIFTRPLISCFAQRFEKMTPEDIRHYATEVDAWIKSVNPFASVAKLRDFLLFQGEPTLELPRLMPYTGFHGIDPKGFSAWSYVYQRPVMWHRAMKFYQIFDPNFQMPNFDGIGCGAASMSRTEIVQELAVQFEQLLIQNADADDERVRLINAISACCAYFTFLFAFVRNMKFEAPDITSLDRENSWDILQQKNPTIVVWTSPLKNLLRKAHSKILSLVSAIHGEKNPRFTIRSFGFADLKLSSKRYPSKLTYLPPLPSLITSGLKNHPLTSKFAGLHPNAMRAYANTRLREMGFYEEDIEAVMGRYQHMLGPFRRHRLESAIHNQQAELFASRLASEIGL